MPASLTRLVDHLLAEAFAACGLPTESARAARAARPDLADLQCNGAMPLAKALGRNPREIATAVADRLRARPELAEVSVAGPGFLNLRLSGGFLASCAAGQAASPELGIEQGPADLVMLDFGGPNVAKPLHVGHLRALVIGESLRRILGSQGVHTVSDIHLGDWGLQMGMLISGIRRRWPAFPPGTLPPLDMSDLQRLYPEAAAACKADPARLEEARAATAALQFGEPDAQAIWRSLREISLAAQLRDVALLGAHFDLLLGESDVQPLIPPMIADLRARGIAVESEGALIIEVAAPDEARPMPPLLLAKSDGAALYATTDLATILARKREYHPARILYVVDQRQALHFEQVFRAARRSGLADGIDLVHVGFGTVNGPDGKPYKTREGGVAQLSDLLGDAIDKARERLAQNGTENGTENGPENRNQADPDTDREQLARLVGLAAVKFADLSSFRTSGYVFDAERLVSFEGRTGPYVQYACVRIGSILARAAEQEAQPGPITVQAAAERALVLECARLPDVVASASRNLAPNEIADYVFSLAQTFSRFYTDCPVLAAASDAERASRLALCALARAVLGKGLWLLGIEVPERM
jgi:arginyl-tRNA synthetase